LMSAEPPGAGRSSFSSVNSGASSEHNATPFFYLIPQRRATPPARRRVKK